MIGKLNHVQIIVSELQRAEDFYTWLLDRLGYKLVDRWQNGCFFSDGLSVISFNLQKFPHNELGQGISKKGIHKVGFSVDSITSLEKLEKELRLRGVQFESDCDQRHLSNCKKIICFRDPDGSVLEIFCLNE